MGFSNQSIGKSLCNIDEIEKQHFKIDQLRSSLDYDIDGLVYKVNDLLLQKSLGILQILHDGQLLINFPLKKL